MNAWNPPPDRLELPADEVHVWLLPRDGIRGLPPVSVLPDRDRARAAAFRREVDRARFRFAHTALRGLLARYVDASPQDVAFSRVCRTCGAEDHGKPHLAAPTRAGNLEFNLSHAGDLVAIAVARGRAVGVDVERGHSDFDWRGVSERFFAPAERHALAAAGTSGAPDLFYEVWTRKEAFLKLTGHGLALPLSSVDVSATLGKARAHVDDAWLTPIDVPDGYAGALAVAGSFCKVRLRVWGPQP